MEPARKPRCRPLPPIVLAQVEDPTPVTSRAELLERLEVALAALPPAERTAVVAAHGYGEGPIGAAMELEVDGAAADALSDHALELLRAALADLADDI